MWFFDTVLEENTKSVATKKDEQDGSFLIIDDSVSADSIPDTAVQLFDATPVESIQDVTPTSEVSFFSEPSVEVEVPSMETSEKIVDSTSIEAPSTENIFFNEPETTIESPLLFDEVTPEVVDTTSLFWEPVTEIVPEITMVMTEENVESHQKKGATSSSLKKIDFDAYIAEKNAELEQFIANNIQLAEVKDAEIVAYNAQIADAKEVEKQAIEMAKKIAKQAIDKAKESAKQALDERKNIELENDRIKEIKARLSIQA